MRNQRILLVDDVASMRSVIKAFLVDSKFERVDEAFDGVSAFELLNKKKYALVICDLEMPKMNGLELLNRIKATKKMQHVQFIMVTCNNSSQKIHASIAAGVDDYIAKPFQPYVLIEKIERCLTKRQNLIEAQKKYESRV